MLCLRYFLIERLLTPHRSCSFGNSGSFMLLAPGYEGANAEEIEECPEHGHSWDGEDNAEETHDLPPAMMARKNARALSGAVVGGSKTQPQQVTREREGEGVPEVSDIGPVVARPYP